MATFNGTGGNDTLTGGNGDDIINGKGGDDLLTGGSGDDTIDGGDGIDTVNAGIGNDRVLVGRGDTVHGDDGNDTLLFSDIGTGIQTFVFGDLGTDKLILDFSGASDAVAGSNDNTGNGAMMGLSYFGIESLVITGGTASDTLVGGAGSDTLTGGAGNDRLDARAGTNLIDGGAGLDIGLIDLSSAKAARVVTFVAGTDLVLAGNTLSNIEGLGLKTGGGKDIIDLTGETIGSEIFTNAGNDSIVGGSGFDSLDAGVGNDTISGGRGDTVHGGDGNDSLSFVDSANTGVQTFVFGDAGVDTLTLDFSGASDALSSSNDSSGNGSIAGLSYFGVETLVIKGGTASDLIVGGAGDDSLTGGAGNDRIDGRAGADTIVGGAGNDIGLIDLSATGTARHVTFVSGTTLSLAGSTLSQIEGLGLKTGSGNDTVDVSGEKIGSEIFTNGGNDQIIGGAGLDSLDGGIGNDVITGGRGDTVHGGDGNDTLLFTGTSNTGLQTFFFGDAGTDVLTLDFSTVSDGFSSSNDGAGNGSMAGLSYFGVETLIVTGGTASDTLAGGLGKDTLAGGAGNDSLSGGLGNDSLTGGRGGDHLTGGAGNDDFVYAALNESTVTLAGQDVITDFAHGDAIDLTALETAVGHSFDFIGTAAFSGHAGELRFEASGPDTLVSLDADGDGAADFAILLTGTVALAASDFTL